MDIASEQNQSSSHDIPVWGGGLGDCEYRSTPVMMDIRVFDKAEDIW